MAVAAAVAAYWWMPAHGQGAADPLIKRIRQEAAILQQGTDSVADAHVKYASAIQRITALEGMFTHGSIADRTLADSLLMELHLADAYSYMHEAHPAQAVPAYRAALVRSATSPTFASRRAEILGSIAGAQRALGDRAAAYSTLDEGCKEFLAHGDKKNARSVLREKGYLCSDLADHRSEIATWLAVRELDRALKEGDDRSETYTELALSRACSAIGSQEAFAHARSAFQLAESNGDASGSLTATDLLITSYDITSQDALCEQLIKRALAMAYQRGIATDIAKFEDRAGRFYMKQGRPNDAEEHLLAGLAAIEGIAPDGGATMVNGLTLVQSGELHQDLGNCYRALDEKEKAREQFLACERLAQAGGSTMLSPWAELGELYLDDGDAAKAATYGERALAKGRSGHDPELVNRASDLLYRVYKQRGDTKDALAMHELFMATSDSLKQEGYRMGMLKKQLEISYRDSMFTDSLAAAHEKDALRVENGITRARTRTLVVGGLALFLLGAVVVYFDRKRRRDRFEKDAAHLETQALRSQMNPHFIFNALNSINAFVQKNEPDRASAFLSRFARLMRLVLENSRQSEVPLKDDLEALDAYLHLERTRSGEKFDYTISVDPSIDQEETMVPPLVIQPFVENAIWHGVAGKEGKGHIKLSVSKRGDQLVMAIEDDGVGRGGPKVPQPGVLEKKNSLGTAITQARLDLVQKQKGKPAGFTYIDLPHGTRVELSLPISDAA